MIEFIKYLLCSHEISSETKSWSPENCFIVSTIIKCNKCGKTFPQNPSNLISAAEIHNKLTYDYWMEKVKNSIQSQGLNK